MSWLQCPECESPETSCIDSRPGEGFVRRRYRCKRGHRWSTVEQLAEPMAALEDREIEFDGRTLTVRKWAKRLGMGPEALSKRLATLPVEEALSRPKYDRGSTKLRVVNRR